jgi:hypothetical protein
MFPYLQTPCDTASQSPSSKGARKHSCSFRSNRGDFWGRSVKHASFKPEIYGFANRSTKKVVPSTHRVRRVHDEASQVVAREPENQKLCYRVGAEQEEHAYAKRNCIPTGEQKAGNEWAKARNQGGVAIGNDVKAKIARKAQNRRTSRSGS